MAKFSLPKLSPPIPSNTQSFGSAIPSFVAKNKIARTNRFIANIGLPTAINLPGAKFISGIEIESAELPSISLQTTEFQYDQSPRISVPILRNPQGQTNITIRLDENHHYRKIFSDWMENIIYTPSNLSSFTGYKKNYYDRYIGSVQILQLGIEGNITAGVTLLNAYPTSIEALRYDWGENDQYHRLNVQFTYFDYIEL